MFAKKPLVVVCAVAFLAGGAAAVVLTRPAAETAGVQAAVGPVAEVGQAATAETVRRAEGGSERASVEEAVVSAGSDPAPESGAVRAESAPTDVEGAGLAESSRRTRGHAAAGRADESPRAARGYARVSVGRPSSGGGGIAGHTVGGVKKTGEGVKKAGAAVGRTFGKIGGLFND